MEKDEEGTRALDLLNALKDLPVSLKVLTETGCGKIAMTMMMTIQMMMKEKDGDDRRT